MKKKIIFCSLLLSLGTVMAQEKKSNISGGFENNSQWYLNDKNLFDDVIFCLSSFILLDLYPP